MIRKTVPLVASVIFAGVTFIALASDLSSEPLDVVEQPITTRITAIPIAFDRDNPEQKTFGKLTYRGGFNLFAKSRHFGGYSGLAIDASGKKMLAVSDRGTWMHAKLDYAGRWLKGIGDVTLGPILGRSGQPLAKVSQRDAEGIALISGDTRNGEAYVSFERAHRILRYTFSPKRFGPPNESVKLPATARSMVSNRGIEAVALIRAGRLKGTVVVFSERLKDQNGNLRGWLIGGASPGTIVIRRIDGFDITDAAGLPDGGLILLERRFRYSEGVKMRIRRIKAADLRPGKLITGEVLLEATDRLNIDNMEAVAVHRGAKGEVVLTLMSDDNFNLLQRSLIMQFALQ
ncbi:MAG: esterase-like activity of phytase family protein [Alphaproteobacteria bacterium]